MQHALYRGAIDAHRARPETADLVGAGVTQRLGVLGEHFVAVRNHRLHRGEIAACLRGVELQLGRDLLHFGQPQRLQHADVQPADVELVPAVRQARGARVSVVVVVQLFPADQYAPRHDVGACVCCFEFAVAPVVPEAVDHARGQERDPRHLHGPDGEADEAEQREVEEEQKYDGELVVPRVEVALEPVIGRPLTVPVERLLVTRFLAVELGAFPQDLVDADDLRAVRIFLGLDLGVVLAVDRGPLLGHHPGGEPQPETEEVAGDRMQVERAVRLAAVEKNGDGGNSDVGSHQGVGDQAPPRQIQDPCEHWLPRPESLYVGRSLPNFHYLA